MKDTKPAQPQWESAIVFSSKKYNLELFWMAYINLNSLIVKNEYIIGRKDKCVSPLGEMAMV